MFLMSTKISADISLSFGWYASLDYKISSRSVIISAKSTPNENKIKFAPSSLFQTKKCLVERVQALIKHSQTDNKFDKSFYQGRPLLGKVALTYQ